jgi:hypothetical protein
MIHSRNCRNPEELRSFDDRFRPIWDQALSFQEMIFDEIPAFNVRFEAGGAAVHFARLFRCRTANGTSKTQGKDRPGHCSLISHCGLKLWSIGHATQSRQDFRQVMDCTRSNSIWEKFSTSLSADHSYVISQFSGETAVTERDCMALRPTGWETPARLKPFICLILWDLS